MSVNYLTVDNKWNQYASKGDIINCSYNGQNCSAVVESATVKSIIVTVSNSSKTLEIPHNNLQVYQKKITSTTSIPIEVNDLVSFYADNATLTGIIVKVDFSNGLATVSLTNGKLRNAGIPMDKLQFIAKGYTPIEMDVKSNAGTASLTSVQTYSTQSSSSQNPSQIALLYPAPCVVMAVPYNTNPDSFPEAMYVQMPDRAPNQPVLLPVVRMGCDTALVVVPPNPKARVATMNASGGKSPIGK